MRWRNLVEDRGVHYIINWRQIVTRASVVFLMHSQVHAHTHTHEQHAKTLVTSHLYLLHCAEWQGEVRTRVQWRTRGSPWCVCVDEGMEDVGKVEECWGLWAWTIEQDLRAWPFSGNCSFQIYLVHVEGGHYDLVYTRPYVQNLALCQCKCPRTR